MRQTQLERQSDIRPSLWRLEQRPAQQLPCRNRVPAFPPRIASRRWSPAFPRTLPSHPAASG